QWTVAPAVQGAAPHQPIGGRRILKHLVRNGNETWRGLLCDGMEAGQQQYQRCNNECYAVHVDVVSTLVAWVEQGKKVELRFAQARVAQPQFQMLCERPPRERSERGGRSHAILKLQLSNTPFNRGLHSVAAPRLSRSVRLTD